MFKIPDWDQDIPKSNVNFGNKTKKNNDQHTETRKSDKKNKTIKVLKPNTNNFVVRNTTPVKKPKINKTTKLKDNNLSPAGKWPERPAINKKFNAKANNTTENKPVITPPNVKKTAKKRKHNGQFATKNEDNKTNLDTSVDFPVRAKKKKFNENAKSHVQEPKNLSKSKQNARFTRSSPENEQPVIFENKVDRKKEKLKKLLQSNRSSITVSGNKLRERMMERLNAAQFRYLNEKLYTSSGSEAQELFQADPAAFRTYHQGYQQQLKKWPVSPLDVIVKKILKMPKTHTIADMGCGEAALAKRVPHSVRSFDLVATTPAVEACDMARTPLLAGSVHAAVYCLALMGTGLTQYLIEANRVLVMGGHLLIAEVESRFDDVEAFARDVEKLGFKLKSLDKTHQVFFFLQFTKVGEPPKKSRPTLTLKPCLYKKR